MVAVKRQQLSPSRSDFDWREAKAQKALAGFIFVCSSSTLPDLDRNLFGLPAYHEENVRAIRRGMPLFLFNYSSRRLYGVYEAASDGGFNIDPFAWENTDSARSGRHGHPMSRYPAQVRVRLRVERPPLEEEVFRPVVEHLEGLKFRLDLNALQVQRLLHLFGVSGAPVDVERMDDRIKGNVYQTVSVNQDPESPRSAFKSDSDCYSECSSRGTNVGEDEWNEEVPNDDGMYRGSMQGYHRHESEEGTLSERLSHISFDDLHNNGNGRLENNLDKDLYSAVPTGEDMGSTTNECNGEQLVWKVNSRKGSQRGRMEMAHSVNDNNVFLRLHDTDPAVNSNSINCLQGGVPQSLTMKRQDNVVTLPMIPAQVQPSFPRENMVYIPVQTVQCPQRGVPNFPVQNQRAKWNDQRKYSRGLLNSNSRKQSFEQDKPSKAKDIRYHKTHLVSDNHQNPHIQSQNLQLGQVLLPLCAQRAGGPLLEQGQVAALLSPVYMSPHAQGLALSQPQVGAGMEDTDEGYDTVNDIHVHQDGVQNLVHSNSQVPILFMQPVMPAMPASPQPITAGFVEQLHFDVLQFARRTRPSLETQLHAEAAIDCVRKGVKMVWPEADVEVFGSFATGLCLQHSDVDLAIVGAPLLPSAECMSIAQVSAFLIRELASSFEEYEWCESINVLDTASMPVLKCHCRPWVHPISTPSIAVDITIGGIRNSDFTWNQANGQMDSVDGVPIICKFGSRHTGGAAREYVIHKIWELPALAPLVLLLKSYLHHKGLSNVYLGGLGSFSLTLLIAFYLERIPINRDIFSDANSSDSPLSPTASSPLSCMSEFSEDSDPTSLISGSSGFGLSHAAERSTCSLGKLYVRRAADVMERVLNLWESGGSPYLGILLLGFLQTFGFVLDLSTERIVLKGIDGSPGGIFKRDDRHVALWIDDPLRPGVNVGAGSFGMFHVQASFREMLQVITQRQLSGSPPLCNDKGCQDLATMGNLASLSCLVMEADDYP